MLASIELGLFGDLLVVWYLGSISGVYPFTSASIVEVDDGGDFERREKFRRRSECLRDAGAIHEIDVEISAE